MLLSPVSPVLSYRAVEFDPELRALLDSTRGLAFTVQADMLDQMLLAYAKRKQLRYLRVTVRNREELEQLRMPLALNSGRLEKLNSPLYDVVYNGGILFLDYEHSDPKLAEEFNSVFDRIARFEGKEVSPNLILIGGMNREHFTRHPTSFYSRYHEVRNKTLPETDLLSRVTSPPKAYSGLRINLHSTSRFRDKLAGKYQFTAEGELVFGINEQGVPGPLVQALKNSEPLLLENAPWKNQAFLYFIRQLYIQKGLQVNGEWLPIKPGFALFRQTVEENAGVQNKRVVSVSNKQKMTWVINTETLDLLMSIPQVNSEHKMTQQPGLLFRPHEKIRLRITEPLPDEFWHQIFHAEGEIEIQVLHSEWIPLVYQSYIDEHFEESKPESENINLDEALKLKASYIAGSDLSVTAFEVKRALPEEEMIVYPVTPETTLADLTKCLEVQPGNSSTAVSFDIPLPKNGVLQALLEGKTILLEGLDRNPKLQQQLKTVFAPKPYLMVNGKPLMLNEIPGRLVLSGNRELPEGIALSSQAVISKKERLEILRELVPDQIRYSGLLELEEKYQKMDLPYPFSLHLDKIKMLSNYPSLVEGFDAVFLNSYVPFPAVHSKMRKEFLNTFKLPDEVSLASLNRSGEQQKDKIKFILTHFNMVYFKGFPGVGKSYITREISEELGYSEDEVYSVLSGAGSRESDLISQRLYDTKKRKSVLKDKVIARWARNPRGGLLVWDEANLTNPDFAQFLSGLSAKKPFIWINGERIELTSRHRIIFTGNPETFEGRHFQNLIEQKVITLNFAPFSRAFLKQKIEELIPVSMEKPRELVEAILDIHEFFETARPELGYSLRDLQELTSRVRLAGNDRAWVPEQVLYIAWNLYSGVLNQEDKLALRALLDERYSNAISGQESQALVKLKHFVEEEAPQAYQGIGWAEGTLKTVESVDAFLKMRKARKGARGKREYLGKWALLLEGPSGTGKDDLVERTLEAHGLEKERDYQVWVASPYRIEELETLLQKAALEGKVIVLSEMNLVETAVLEGMLNTLLTEQGVFKPGFEVIGTINSVDFQGREAFSTAFKNRLNYHAVTDHSQAGLYKLAQSRISNDKAIKALVGCHCWIRDRASGPHQYPTLREFFRALDRLRQGEETGSALQSVYGPVYFENMFSDETIPTVKEFADYKEKDPVNWEKAYRTLAEVIAGKKRASKMRFAKANQGNNPLPNLILQNTLAVSGETGCAEAWQSIIAGSVRHLFHLPKKDISLHRTAEAYPLYLALEHTRLLLSAKKFNYLSSFPLFDSEQRLQNALNRLDLNYFIRTSEQDLFVSMLVLAGLGKVQLDDARFIQLCEASDKPGLPEKAKQALPQVLEYLNALPESTIMNDVLEAQSKAFQFFKSLKEVYKNCSNFSEPGSAYEEGDSVETKPAVQAQTPKEIQAEIEHQKQARLEAKRKALFDEIDAARKQLIRPLDEKSQTTLEIYRVKLRDWPQRAKKLDLNINPLMPPILKIVVQLRTAVELNKELDALASEISYGINKKPIKVLLEEADSEDGIFSRISNLNEHQIWKKYLTVKAAKLKKLLQYTQHLDRLPNSNRSEGSVTDFLGDAFSLNPDNTSGFPASDSKDYTGGYVSEGTVTRRSLSFYSPYVFPNLRMKALSRISNLTASKSEEVAFHPVPIETGSENEWKEKGFQVFRGKIELSLEPGIKTPLPSIGDEQHFFNVENEELFRFFKDTDDLYYVESKAKTGPITISFSAAVPNRYFGIKIAETLEVNPADKPAELSADILWALNKVGLKPEEKNFKKIVRTLSHYIHSFTDKPIPIEKRSGNPFRDTIHFKSGACIERAHAFAVLAHALGIRTRIIRNSDRDGKGLHAFPEIFVPGSGWLRIGALGGQFTIVDTPKGKRHQPSNEVDFARAEAIRSTKRKPSKKDSSIPEKETVHRQVLLEKLTKKNQERLRQLLKEACFYTALKNSGAQQASQQGSHLSVQQLVQDPSRPYLSVAPQLTLLPKRLIFTDPIIYGAWHPLLEEIIFFLLEQGVKIAVYEGEDVEPFPVDSVIGLKLRMSKAPAVSEKKIRQYVTREANPETTGAVSLRELQRRVEAFYLEEVFLKAFEGREPGEHLAELSEKGETEKDGALVAQTETKSEGLFDWIKALDGPEVKTEKIEEDSDTEIVHTISPNGKYYIALKLDGSIVVRETASKKEILFPGLDEKLARFTPFTYSYISNSGKLLVLFKKGEFLFANRQSCRATFMPQAIEKIEVDEFHSSLYLFETDRIRKVDIDQIESNPSILSDSRDYFSIPPEEEGPFYITPGLACVTNGKKIFRLDHEHQSLINASKDFTKKASRIIPVPGEDYFLLWSDSIQHIGSKDGPIPLSKSLSNTDFEEHPISISHDGKWLGYIDFADLILIHTETGAVKNIQLTNSSQVPNYNPPVFLPDGSGIAVYAYEEKEFLMIKKPEGNTFQFKDFFPEELETTDYSWLRDPNDPTKATPLPPPFYNKDRAFYMPASRNGRYGLVRIDHGKKVMGETWHHTMVLDLEEDEELAIEEALPTVLVTDDGEIVVFQYHDHIEVYYPASGKRITLLDKGHNIQSIALSPDQDALLVVNKAAHFEVYRLPLPGSTADKLKEANLECRHRHPLFLQTDGTGYVEINRDKGLISFFKFMPTAAIATWTQPLPDDLCKLDIHDLAISPDKSLIVLRHKHTLNFIPIRDSSHYFTAEIGNAALKHWRGIYFSPDGRELRLYLTNELDNDYVRCWVKPQKTEPVQANILKKAAPITAREFVDIKSNRAIGQAEAELKEENLMAVLTFGEPEESKKGIEDIDLQGFKISQSVPGIDDRISIHFKDNNNEPLKLNDELLVVKMPEKRFKNNGFIFALKGEGTPLLLAAGENHLYYAEFANIVHGAVRIIDDFDITDPLSKTQTPGLVLKTQTGKIKLATVHYDTNCAAVLTEDGKVSIYHLLNSAFELPRKVELEVPADANLAKTARKLFFSPDGAKLYVQTDNKLYTWTFFSKKFDFTEIHDYFNNLMPAPYSDSELAKLLIPEIIGHLAAPSETLNQLMKSMEKQGKTALYWKWLGTLLEKELSAKELPEDLVNLFKRFNDQRGFVSLMEGPVRVDKPTELQPHSAKKKFIFDKTNKFDVSI